MIVNDIINQVEFEIGDREREYPLRFYLQSINEALDSIYIWLLENKIYTKILTQEINTAQGKENYLKDFGKTILVKLNTQELEVTNIEKRKEFISQGIPQKYYETITDICFIPIPNGIYKIIRTYIFYPQVTSSLSDIELPDNFDRLIVLLSALKTINLFNDDDKWLVQRANFSVKWNEEIIAEKNKLYNYYKTLEKPINYFSE